jgi:hypothetical protein
MFLHYRNDLGLDEQAPIMAVRSVETNEGQVLFLWIRLKPEDEEEDEDDNQEDEGLE